MKDNFKKAITLAEIMIVVVIIAIVALVFLAMPRKNIGKMDRTKYYIAYNTLKRMQEEQIAQVGKVAINTDYDTPADGIAATDNIATNEDFGRAVITWLNVNNPPAGGGRIRGQDITLTNGMIIRIPNADANNCPNAFAGADGRIPQCLDVTIDIDGADDNGNICSGGTDCHIFTLYSDGFVTPDDSDGEWIRFKVFYYNQNPAGNGEKIVERPNISFADAAKRVCCKNNNDMTACYYLVKDDNENPIDLTQANCGIELNDGLEIPGPIDDNGMRFMEVIPPLK